MRHGKKIVAGILTIALVLGVAVSTMGAGSSASEQPSSNTPEVTVLSASAPAPIFSDVSADAWYAEAVQWCRDNGIMSGTSNTTFSPNNTMTRAMLAVVLYRAEGSPQVSASASFTDVAPSSWYGDAAAWASENGIMSGYGDGTFGADDPVTREQIATILWRYDGSAATAESAGFADATSISSYAVQAVDWAAEQGIVAGRDGNRFDPQASATRAEVAVILYRYLSGGQSNEPAPTPDDDSPDVFMTTDISADGLMAIYEALEASPTGNIAVKLSTGEPGSNYLRTDLIGPLVQSFEDPTIVECNTAYGGARSSTAMHYQVAEDHGYTAIADVDIMDEEGSMTLPVTGGSNLTENYVGSHFANYDYFVVLSHFKGHAMAGYGGAIKNISIGMASQEGKCLIHTAGESHTSPWGGDQDAFLESMAEAGKSVVDALDGNILYINVMNRLSVDCDCDSSPAEPDMHDIGILASYDPVALDQACIDLVYAAEDGQSLIDRIESRNGLHTLEHAEAIGLGSREYNLVSIDG